MTQVQIATNNLMYIVRKRLVNRQLLRSYLHALLATGIGALVGVMIAISIIKRIG